MSESQTGDEREVIVQPFLRTTMGPDAVSDTLRRLRQLDVEGVLAVQPVQRWPATVCLSSDGRRSGVLDVYQEFATWADHADKSLEPGFRTRTRRSELTGESNTVLTLPVISLAVYVDRALTSVFPHADGDGVHSVADAVEGFEIDRPVGRERPSPSATVTCPDCGSRAVNVQGLLACPDCGWVEETETDRRQPVVRSR